MQSREQGAWAETVDLFSAVREGRQQAARRLLETTATPGLVIGNLLSLLGVLVRGIDPDELDHFVEAARRVCPPPEFGLRPDPQAPAPGGSGSTCGT